MISRLRADANLKHLYAGEQKRRGARRKYDGKVDFSDLSRLAAETLPTGGKLMRVIFRFSFLARLEARHQTGSGQIREAAGEFIFN